MNAKLRQIPRPRMTSLGKEKKKEKTRYCDEIS